VGSDWTLRDWFGAVSVRLNVGRMNYRVPPGLYPVGQPDATAPVFVTANYKLTFDHVRRALRGLNAWLLVLDTLGVNVWCAAGKGTFSTAELCRRIEATGLDRVVSHRRLVLPQLGAVGVAAHEVAKATGFTVVYGPVRADDIPAWLRAGRRKDPAMRTVRFGLLDRLLLVPVEIVNARVYALGLLAVALVLALIRGRGLSAGFPSLFAGHAVQLLGAVVAGGLLVPVLLPWLPTRSFAFKGAVIGLAWTALAWAAAPHSGGGFWVAFSGGYPLAGAALLTAAIAAFVGLNFTGATVFTSQSGTMLETKIALPVIGVTAAAGLILQMVGAIQGPLS
jgi:acetyl-CoA decarbonylase/synthase complex subunit gamma